MAGQVQLKAHGLYAILALTLMTATTASSAAEKNAAAKPAPANNLQDLWHELNSCIVTPSLAEGSEITLVFALKRDGSLLGKPRITHSHLVGTADAQTSFVAAAIAAVANCLPLRITDGLGGAIAGHPLAIRIISRAPQTKI